MTIAGSSTHPIAGEQEFPYSMSDFPGSEGGEEEDSEEEELPALGFDTTTLGAFRTMDEVKRDVAA